MHKIQWKIGHWLGVLLLVLPFCSQAQQVVSIRVDGAIQPVTAEYIQSGIKRAVEVNAECLVIHLNTPGGLLKSTRVIVSDILASPIPVVVFVAPSGAHAGSAGVFITLAAHVAAMAPTTNIGAAHPVSMQGGMDSVMSEKTTNDAAAFIRSIAEKRQRNLDWAEEAVRRSVSISEREALEKDVINLIAIDEKDLLIEIDGWEILMNDGTVRTLNTREATVERLEMSALRRFLNLLSDPNIAYILMLLGLYGILFELYNPGAIIPGTVGVISLILAFYALHTLPINYAGLALIVFALVLFVAELYTANNGLLTAGGVLSLLLGSIMLIKSDSALEWVRISLSVIITATILSALFFTFIIGMGLKAQRNKVVTGKDALIGDTGVTLSLLNPKGTIRIQGEIWQAVSVSGTLQKGETVKVVSIKDLVLYVEPISSS